MSVTVSNCFLVFHTFSWPLTLYLTVSHCFLVFHTVSHCFKLFPGVSHCFSLVHTALFLTVSHCFLVLLDIKGGAKNPPFSKFDIQFSHEPLVSGGCPSQDLEY